MVLKKGKTELKISIYSVYYDGMAQIMGLWYLKREKSTCLVLKKGEKFLYLVWFTLHKY